MDQVGQRSGLVIVVDLKHPHFIGSEHFDASPESVTARQTIILLQHQPGCDVPWRNLRLYLDHSHSLSFFTAGFKYKSNAARTPDSF